MLVFLVPSSPEVTQIPAQLQNALIVDSSLSLHSFTLILIALIYLFDQMSVHGILSNYSIYKKWVGVHWHNRVMVTQCVPELCSFNGNVASHIASASVFLDSFDTALDL